MWRILKISFVLAFLLLPSAWSGQVIGPIQAGPGIHPDNVGKCWESKDSKDGVWSEGKQVPCPQDTQCRAKMEAAMRAMEPFTPAGNAFRFERTGTEEAIHIYQQQKITKIPVEAVGLWVKAREECWRQP